MRVVSLEVVEYEQNGITSKTHVRVDVSGKSRHEIVQEKDSLMREFPGYGIVEVELVPPVQVTH